MSFVRTLAPWLVVLLSGCPGSPGESGETGDSADTGACVPPDDTAMVREETTATFADTDDTCDRSWSEPDTAGWASGAGCGWAYVYLLDPDRYLSLHLGLPADDVDADADFTYSLVPGFDAELELLDTSAGGGDSISFWTCSDYSEQFDGGVLWTGVSGEVRVETRWVCDTTDPSCGFDESEIHAQVSLLGVGLQSSAGECTELPDTVVRVTLGISECGG